MRNIVSDEWTSYVGKEFYPVSLDEIPVSLTELTTHDYAVAWRMGADYSELNKTYFSVHVLIMSKKDNANEYLLKACEYIKDLFKPQSGISIRNYLVDGSPQVNTAVILNITNKYGIKELKQGFKFREYEIRLTMPI